MNFLMQFLVMIVLVMLAAAKVTIQGRGSRKYILNSQDTLLFNGQMFFVISFFTIIVFGLRIPDVKTVLICMGVAVTMLIYQATYAMALGSGPVSLTVLIANMNVLITTGGSIVVFGDKLYLTQGIGIVFLILSMILTTQKSEDDARANKKWLLLTLTSLVTAGINSLVQKGYALAYVNTPLADSAYVILMNFFAGLFSLIYYGICRVSGRKMKHTRSLEKGAIGYAVAVGIVMVAFNKLYMYAGGIIDGTFFFPVYNGLMSIMMSVIGVVFFKDQLSNRQKLGILCGVFCLALMNLRVGFSF